MDKNIKWIGYLIAVAIIILLVYKGQGYNKEYYQKDLRSELHQIKHHSEVNGYIAIDDKIYVVTPVNEHPTCVQCHSVERPTKIDKDAKCPIWPVEKAESTDK